jgi:hypothetical protein
LETSTVVEKEKLPAKYTINPHKLEKYLPRLLNGEAHKLETWLPNLLANGSGIGGSMERETYDYRVTQFRRKDGLQYNTRVALVVRKLEEMRRVRDELLGALADFKLAADGCHDKYKRAT